MSSYCLRCKRNFPSVIFTRHICFISCEIQSFIQPNPISIPINHRDRHAKLVRLLGTKYWASFHAFKQSSAIVTSSILVSLFSLFFTRKNFILYSRFADHRLSLSSICMVYVALTCFLLRKHFKHTYKLIMCIVANIVVSITSICEHIKNISAFSSHSRRFSLMMHQMISWQTWNGMNNVAFMLAFPVFVVLARLASMSSYFIVVTATMNVLPLFVKSAIGRSPAFSSSVSISIASIHLLKAIGTRWYRCNLWILRIGGCIRPQRSWMGSSLRVWAKIMFLYQLWSHLIFG